MKPRWSVAWPCAELSVSFATPEEACRWLVMYEKRVFAMPDGVVIQELTDCDVRTWDFDETLGYDNVEDKP